MVTDNIQVPNLYCCSFTFCSECICSPDFPGDGNSSLVWVCSFISTRAYFPLYALFLLMWLSISSRPRRMLEELCAPGPDSALWGGHRFLPCWLCVWFGQTPPALSHMAGLVKVSCELREDIPEPVGWTFSWIWIPQRVLPLVVGASALAAATTIFSTPSEFPIFLPSSSAAGIPQLCLGT